MSDWWGADPVYSPERFRSNPRGFTTNDVQAAVRGDMFNAPGLPIQYAAQPGQTFGVDATRNAQPIQNIVAHHTGSTTLDSALNTARRGDPFRGDVKYGYHFYIDTDGAVVQGAPMDARTNHVQPPGAQNRTSRPDIGNSNSVGISFVGSGGQPTAQQLAAARNLSTALMDRYGIQTQNVVGHGEIQNNRQAGEGMPLVNAIRNPPTVAQAPQAPEPQPAVPGIQAGGVANAGETQVAPLPPPASYEKPAQANWWDNDPQQQKQDIGQLTAGAIGAGQGATFNFGDELAGVMAAGGLPTSQEELKKNPAALLNILPQYAMATAVKGAGRLGYENIVAPMLGINPGGISGQVAGDQRGEATKRYETTRDQVRAATKTAQEQYPGTYLAGNVAGGAALPLGVVGQAATLPGRIALGTATGAGVGGLSGIGEGENAADRATKGAIGAAVGAGVGAVAPPLVEGAIQVGRTAINPLVNAVRGAVNPEAEAGRRIVGALERDIRTDPQAVNRLTPQEFTASQQAGGPARVVDLGGDTTKALARSAANTSPEGRQILNQTINDRYEGQTTRINDWLNNTFHYPNADAQQQAITQVARTVNRGAYQRAYQAGDRQIWSPELERLTSSPDVVDAMREAATKGKSRAVVDGFGGMNAGVTVENGMVWFQRGPNGQPTYPNLQFWDYTKRALDDAANAARRSGRNEEASTLGNLARTLRGELDTQVPSYAQARAGAAQFFGAEDALQAGQNYVRQNFATGETRRALAGMTQAERQLFQDGFVSRFVETLNQTGDRRNVLNQIASSPAAREKLNLALGPQRAAELEAALRVEGIMDTVRTAVQGNSTTARQLAELGLAGGSGLTGIVGVYNQDPNTLTIAGISAALLAGKRGIDTRVARHVATMLASDNPQVIARGLGIVARNTRFMDALRTADRRIAAAGGVEGSQVGAPMLQAAGAGRADDQPGVPRPPGQ